MKKWQPIETAPAAHPVLVKGPNWKHADVCMMYEEDGWWYSPVDGSDIFPQPTEWMDIPE